MGWRPDRYEVIKDKEGDRKARWEKIWYSFATMLLL